MGQPFGVVMTKEVMWSNLEIPSLQAGIDHVVGKIGGRQRRLLAALYLRQRQALKADEVLQPALAALPNDPTLISASASA